MRLLLAHPKIANRDCQLCLKYNVDEDTGLFTLGRDGKPEERLTNFGPSFLAPCRDPNRGCPKGSPESPRTLNEVNQRAYEHYLECRAVGVFPDDPIVRRNARVIREIEDRIQADKAEQDRRAIRTILKSVAGG